MFKQILIVALLLVVGFCGALDNVIFQNNLRLKQLIQ